MRHLLFLFALALGLAACDDATTAPAPAETIPGPGENPRLSVTVLTGTKAAPVDSPTVKVQWWYNGNVTIGMAGMNDSTHSPYGNAHYWDSKSSGDTAIKVGCEGKDSLLIVVGSSGSQSPSGTYDSARVYCKAP